MLNRIYTLSLFLLILTSCVKNEVEDSNQIANVSFTLVGTEYISSARGNPKGKTAQVRQINKQIGKDEFIEVLLVENSLDQSRTFAGNKLSNNFKNEIVKSKIPKGTSYRVLIFDEDRKFLYSKDYVVGEDNAELLTMEAGDLVNFVIYSYGKADPLPNHGLNIGDNISQLAIYSSAGDDLMIQKIEDYKLAVGHNKLDIVLKHIFTKLSFEINSSHVGQIVEIGDVILSGNFFDNATTLFNATADISIYNEFMGPRSVQVFSDLIVAQNSLSSSSKNDRIIYVQGDENDLFDLEIKSLAIETLDHGFIKKSNLILPSFNLRAGTSYNIIINITKFDPESSPGIIVDANSNLAWATGNLILDDGVYKFAERQNIVGDHWIYNWLEPQGRTTMEEYKITEAIAGKYTADNDPCGKVIVPDGSSKWRTPTLADYEELFVEKGSESNRYKVFAGKMGTVSGVYFGISSESEITPDVMFLPYGGTRAGWQTSPPANPNDGWYQSADLKDANNYYGLQIRDDVAVWGLAQFIQQQNYIHSATPIRCVRDR